MRDTRRDMEYFDRHTKWLVRHEKMCLSGLLNASEEKMIIHSALMSSLKLYRIMKVMYSTGCDIREIMRFYPYMLVLKECYTDTNNYSYTDLIELISFGVCTECPVEVMKPLAAIADKGKGWLHDGFSDRMLIKCGLAESVFKEKVNWNPYKYLMSIFMTDDKTEQEEIVKNFIRRWYLSNRNSRLFFDEQLTQDRGYIGYWCFESAGLVRLFGLDDEIIKKSPYYTYDLAHCDMKWSDEEVSAALRLYDSDIKDVAQSLLNIMDEMYPDVKAD